MDVVILILMLTSFFQKINPKLTFYFLIYFQEIHKICWIIMLVIPVSVYQTFSPKYKKKYCVIQYVYAHITITTSIHLSIFRAGSLNKDAVPSWSEPILKAAHLTAILKRKIPVVSRKHLRNIHQLGGSSHLPLSVTH